MFFLSSSDLGFGYEELLRMEHCERLKWCDLLIEHNKRVRENVEREIKKMQAQTGRR